MKIVSFADKEGSAIDRLAKMNQKRFGHLKYKHMCVHPKRPSEEVMAKARELIKWADVIDAVYWKTAVLLRKLFPEMENKKIILTHQNEHNILDTEKNHWEWKDMVWDKIVAKNQWQYKHLKSSSCDPIFIRHAVEFDDFSFIPQLTKEKVVGYVGQIKKVKGVRELKQACDQLGYKLMIIGKPSEAEYWANFNKEGLIHYTDVPDGKIGELFHQMRVFCCNSDDGTESGTMPILEAMVAGIPVVTRKIGTVRDVGKHQENMIIREGKYTDVEDLKASLRILMENEDISNELRENAWRAVRPYHPEVQSREYNKLYHKVLYPNSPIVSILMPTFNRAHLLTEQFEVLNNQTYQNFEVVICDDGSTDETKSIVQEARGLYDYPIKYVNTGDTKAYGLAKVRNLGVIESIGEIIVLCDDRLRLDPDAIKALVEKLQGNDNHKYWVWGSKGQFKQFVENFSATWRKNLIDGGMFNERMTQYGGLTQETNARYTRQGIKFDWCPEALATPIMGTHSKSKHRQDIIKSKMTLFKMDFQ